MEGLDPWAPVRAFSDGSCTRCWSAPPRLLAANTGGGRRVTTGRRSPGEALWVYRRTGRPCRRCGTLVQARRQGSSGADHVLVPELSGSADDDLPPGTRRGGAGPAR